MVKHLQHNTNNTTPVFHFDRAQHLTLLDLTPQIANTLPPPSSRCSDSAFTDEMDLNEGKFPKTLNKAGRLCSWEKRANFFTDWLIMRFPQNTERWVDFSGWLSWTREPGASGRIGIYLVKKSPIIARFSSSGPAAMAARARKSSALPEGANTGVLLLERHPISRQWIYFLSRRSLWIRQIYPNYRSASRIAPIITVIAASISAIAAVSTEVHSIDALNVLKHLLRAWRINFD